MLADLGVACGVFGGAQPARVGLDRRQLRQWDEERARVDSPRRVEDRLIPDASS